MRIVFIGTVEFSLRALERLVALNAEIVGVCTLQESKFNADHIDLSSFSEAHGIPSLYADDINATETLTWIQEKSPDVIFCFGWSRLIKEDLLELAPLGVVGFHPSALPANRGRHPIIWTLVLGLKKTASTFFFMDEGADSGDILSQRHVSISELDDAGTLYDKITKTALDQIEQFVPTLANKTFTMSPQDHSSATYLRKRGRLDGQIDWRMSAVAIHNLVRGLSKPYVGSHFIYDGNDVKVWHSEPLEEKSTNIEPGKILSVDDHGIIVKTGVGKIRLIHIEPQVTLIQGEYL